MNLYLQAKDSYEAKYQLLTNKQESIGLKNCNNSKVFIEYSNHMNDIEEYNPNKKPKMTIAFNDMIANMLTNKKLHLIITELFNRGRT